MAPHIEEENKNITKNKSTIEFIYFFISMKNIIIHNLLKVYYISNSISIGFQNNLSMPYIILSVKLLFYLLI